MAAKILTDPKQENDFLNHLGLDNLIVLCQKIAKPLHYRCYITIYFKFEYAWMSMNLWLGHLGENLLKLLVRVTLECSYIFIW